MTFLLLLPVLLFSVVVHEVAHAWVALREGDPTAERLGRITLNPLRHLDPVGSILVPLALYILPGGVLFGWAKPVPVDPRNYRDPVGGDIRVSLAGIVSNLVLALLSTLLLALLVRLPAPEGSVMSGSVGVLATMATYGIFINLILAIFNLIPIPPLDGSHVLRHLLPPRLRLPYAEMGRYGLLLIMALVFVFPGALRWALAPVEWLFATAMRIAGAG